MYVYFDMDEATRLKILDLIEKGKITAPAEGGMQVRLGLQNEEGFPHTATIDFTNNQINSTTGSITMRGVLANPPLIPGSKASGKAGPKAPTAKETPAAEKASNPAAAPSTVSSAGKPPLSAANRGQSVLRRFTPGMFVRVQLPIGQPHEALLVIDRAIQSDQGLKFIYVVDARNKVQTRSIKTGSLQEDGLRVVEEGIEPGDWVVVGAIQQVRAQMEVKPEQRLMPTLAGQSEPAPATTGGTKGSGKK
jgi:multidrug efflux system membrane fusion protein